MTEGSGYGPYAYSDSPGQGGYGSPGRGGYGFPPPPPPPKRRGGRMLSHLAVAVLAAAVGVGATLALYQPDSGSSASGSPALPGAGAVPQPGSSSGAGGSVDPQSIVNKVQPGMVIINSSLQYNGEAGAGSGMVINGDGLVLTNNHVIENSTKLSATVVSTGKTYPATVLGYDKTRDIALLKLQDASGLHTIPLGNSSTVKAGDQVVALGNAEGQGTVVPAAGQITGINRTITASDQGGTVTSETLRGMLETNANIVSGDSGGPLSNSSGQVIGMDTAGDSVNVGEQAPASGFAIPINTALSVARQIASGHASPTIQIGYPPFIGVFIASGSNPDPKQQAAKQQQAGNGNPFGGGAGGGSGNGFGPQQPSCYTSNANLQIPQNIAPASSGTLVDGVICGSPAAQAGLTGGAVITAVNGQQAGAPQHLSAILAKLKPGQTAAITWVSPQGKQTTSSLHLVQGPPQ
ncbi:MAG: trypsin-like peptidase domain-containing protein [Nocardiopsaceae bacterium]|nr:trypsin-like peptidase domain-containing protein [Nocardiopsaceae bacterium]